MNSGLLVPDQQTSFICMYLGIYHSDQDRAHFQLEGSLGCLLCQYQSTPLALSCTCYSDVNQHGLVLPVLYLCIRGNILHVLFCVWLFCQHSVYRMTCLCFVQQQFILPEDGFLQHLSLGSWRERYIQGYSKQKSVLLYYQLNMCPERPLTPQPHSRGELC